MEKAARPTPLKTIGLLGGCSNIATQEYYKIINDEVNNQLSGWETAEILISSMNFGNIEKFCQRIKAERTQRLPTNQLRETR